MRHTIIRYIKNYGNMSFKEKSFSPEDALALTILSYLKMEGLVHGFGVSKPVPIRKLAAEPGAGQMFVDPIYGKSHRRIFTMMAESRRFGHIRLRDYVTWSDRTHEVQFAAVSFMLGMKSTFIAFRGTDETLNGWKENFNMGYLPSIPSQKRALSYLIRVAASTEGEIITAGHSKGGNLALYSACFAPENVRQRIRRIYDFDGPGMQTACRKTQAYQCVRNRHCKIVPEDSVIGMIFQTDSNYRVVRSFRRGLLQHDVLQWIIVGDHFCYVTGIRKKYQYISHILNYWIHSLTGDQISAFVDILYRLVCAAHVKNVYELVRRPFYTLYAFHAEFFRLDKAQKKLYVKAVGRLLAAPFVSVINAVFVKEGKKTSEEEYSGRE